jgi:hypothetical protein
MKKIFSLFTILIILIPHALHAKVDKKASVVKIKALLSKPLQLRCNMGSCSWANVQTIKKIENSQDLGELHEISYTYGSSNHTEETTYPALYSTNIPIEWEKNFSKVMVYCSPIKPAVFSSKSLIETFEFPIWFGYEIPAIKLYMYTCHDRIFTGNNEIFNELGYGEIQRKKFDTIEELVR